MTKRPPLSPWRILLATLVSTWEIIGAVSMMTAILNWPNQYRQSAVKQHSALFPCQHYLHLNSSSPHEFRLQPELCNEATMNSWLMFLFLTSTGHAKTQWKADRLRLLHFSVHHHMLGHFPKQGSMWSLTVLELLAKQQLQRSTGRKSYWDCLCRELKTGVGPLQ